MKALPLWSRGAVVVPWSGSTRTLRDERATYVGEAGRSLFRVSCVSAVVALGLMAVASNGTEAPDIGTLRLIGVQTLPHHMAFRDTIVGGLSGIDYDAKHDLWIAVSDDRSDLNPARWYELKLSYDQAKFTPVEVIGVTFPTQVDHALYPNKKTVAARGGEVPDLESIRFDPRDASIWYASEGDRSLGMNPFVRHAGHDGAFQAELPLPAMFQFSQRDDWGPRDNLTIEGVSFAPNGETLWVTLEAPLIQDGPTSTLTVGAVVRVTQVDRSGNPLGQYGYSLEPIPVAAAPGKLASNGVAEVLAVDAGRLLILERAGAQDVTGVFRYRTRLFEAGVAGATDVLGLTSLSGANFQVLKKRLVLDFAEAGHAPVDNLEGMAWGPRLANGHPTLVFVSDDNFSADQQTQFWAFEVMPAATGSVAPAPKRSWDDRFEGVVHDEKAIRGFVADYRWLSNFLPCRVEWEGRVYGSSEAAYQSAKYPASERDVFTTLDPDGAKKLSRIKPYDTAAWDARKEASMRAILAAKFTQHPELAAQLIATGDRVLEETNWWGDTFWGVYEGKGKNVLGVMLMELRSQLAEAAAR